MNPEVASVLVALIVAVAEYQTVRICLRHRAARQAADRKAAAAKEQAK